MSEQIPPHRLVNGRVVPLTDAEITARAAEEAADAARPRRWEVPKLIVIDRLRAAGKLRQAVAALKVDAAPATLTDAELARRFRWDAATVIASDDADAIALIAAVGANPAVILARP